MSAEGIKELRVLHCPTSTGGNPQNLARSERLLGLKFKLVNFGVFTNFTGFCFSLVI